MISFLGVDSKVGTTMISQSIAQIKEAKGEKVLVICELLEEEPEYLGHSKLKSYKKLDVVSWEKLFPSKETLHPKEIQKILLEIALDYDVMIIDLSHDLNNPVAVGALEISDINIIITTQQRSANVRLKHVIDSLIIPMNIKPRLLINKYIDGALLDIKDLSKNEIFQCVDFVRYNPYGWQAEEEKKTLLGHLSYNKELKKYETTI